VAVLGGFAAMCQYIDIGARTNIQEGIGAATS